MGELIVMQTSWFALSIRQLPNVSYIGGKNMPNFDGTGPMGKGPRTGRGRGICRETKGTSSPWTKILLPIVAAAAEELLNPNSIFHRKIKQIFSKKSPKEIEMKPEKKKLEYND